MGVALVPILWHSLLVVNNVILRAFPGITFINDQQNLAESGHLISNIA